MSLQYVGLAVTHGKKKNNNLETPAELVMHKVSRNQPKKHFTPDALFILLERRQICQRQVYNMTMQ